MKSPSWPLVAALGAVALLRPAYRIVADQTALSDSRAVTLLLTLVLAAVWVGAVVLLRASEPVLTLAAAGVVYAVLAIALSAALSPFLVGELDGPLARPWTILPMIGFNAAYGALLGLVAAALQRRHRPVSEAPAARRS